LIEFLFAAKSLPEALPQKSEQFFCGPELQSVAAIHFFHRPFELALCVVCLGSQSYYKRSSHNGQCRVVSEIKACRSR
jgi:hypothetical protein